MGLSDRQVSAMIRRERKNPIASSLNYALLAYAEVEETGSPTSLGDAVLLIGRSLERIATVLEDDQAERAARALEADDRAEEAELTRLAEQMAAERGAARASAGAGVASNGRKPARDTAGDAGLGLGPA